MVHLFGRNLTRREVEAFSGSRDKLAGVELVTLADGPGRGVRVLQARTGAGLSFQIAVDRGFDLLSGEYRGTPFGWHGAPGVRHPGLITPEGDAGFGFLRGFTGLVSSCGLEHILGPERGDASNFSYPRFSELDYPLHGRIANAPARLIGYGTSWQGDEAVIWAEGEVTQAMIHGEHLGLVRRIEADLGGETITIKDRVENRGFRPTVHMMLYHVNFGFPLLDAETEVLAPVRSVIAANHDLDAQGVGWRRQVGPQEDFAEQVWQHEVIADSDGIVPTALINPNFSGGGPFGVLLEYDQRQLPVHLQWQAFQAGLYALAIEPATNHLPGRKFGQDRGELVTLDHGQAARYELRLTVLDGAAVVDATRRRIAALQGVADEFATPTGEYPNLRGRE